MRGLIAATILMLAGLFSTQTLACECLWQGSFTDVQGDTDLVVSTTVVSHKGNSIDLEVEQVLRGTEYNPDIRIWLKMAQLCRPKVGTFPPGSRWVMALHRISEDDPDGFDPSTPNFSYGRIGDYALSSCGGYYLSLTENLVSGNLAAGTRWEMDPEMTPVILDLVASFVRGQVDANALLDASREDPALRQMMLNTKHFIREERYGVNREPEQAEKTGASP